MAAAPAHRTKAAGGAPASMWREIVSGLRLTFGNPYPMVETLFALYAVRELGMSPGQLGLVLAVGSVGALVGSLSAGWLSSSHCGWRCGLARPRWPSPPSGCWPPPSSVCGPWPGPRHSRRRLGRPEVAHDRLAGAGPR